MRKREYEYNGVVVMNAGSGELKFAIDLAHQAGEVLMSYFGSVLTRQVKTYKNDFVTEADVAAEKLILSAIRKEFPHNAILAEESGQHAGTSGYTWIIDPLDGTRNFAERKEIWGVMIARARGDKVVLSAVYNPLKETMAWAEEGKGTYFNNIRIIIQPRLAFSEIEPLLTGLPSGSLTARVQALRDRLAQQGIQLRRGSAMGVGLEALSAAHDLRLSTPPGKIWDHAPISLLLAEAGLTVTNFSGEPYIWHRDSDGFLAAAPALHAQILPLLKG